MSNLAQAMEIVYKELEAARGESLVAQAYQKAITRLYEDIGMRRAATCLYMDDIFDTSGDSFDINEFLIYWEQVASKLESKGYAIVSFWRDEDDFSATVQIKS